MADQKIHPSGKLVVITGRPAAGKDFVANILQSDPMFAHWNFSRLVTYATRPPRPTETHGKEHYFISHEELMLKHKLGELVESPVLTGSSYKATPKKEFHKILNAGQRLYWRIDPSLAVQVAKGNFYDQTFEAPHNHHLKKSTLVLFIDSPKEVLERRRRERDGKHFNPSDYSQRDKYEQEVLDQNPDTFRNIIQNLDDQIDELKNQLFQILSAHMLK